MNVLLIFVACWVFIALGGFLSAMALCFARYAALPSKDAEPVFAKREAAFDPDWLAERGFERDVVLAPLGIRLAFWRDATRCVDLLAYSDEHRGILDLITEWPHGVAVTTTSSGSIGALALPPGDLKQGLPRLTPSQLYDAHLAAVALVSRRLSKAPRPVPSNADALRIGIQRQLKYHLVRPWLILTLPYRNFVTRFRQRGVTLAQQDRRGRIDWDRLARLDLTEPSRRRPARGERRSLRHLQTLRVPAR